MDNNFEITAINKIITLKLLNAISINYSLKHDIFKVLDKHIKDSEKIIIDLNLITTYDSYLPLLIKIIQEYVKSNKLTLEIICNSSDIKNFIEIYEDKPKEEFFQKIKQSAFLRFFTRIGNIILILIHDGIKFLEFIGEVSQKLLNLIIRPMDMRWSDFPMHFTKSGVNAVPIVILIVFLIGIITGYQGAIQLKQFGADIFIADLVGISITRELAPLMTAILAAGRSGASFAAEIGTMKVSDEIDALNSMGFDHIKFLVLPRIVAVVIAMPLITILADFFGILGGMITGLTTLNITFSGFMNEMQRSLGFGDLFSGLIKSMMFGFLIATIGCFRGLQVRGGAESVGHYTTASVVTGVLLVIITDAIMIFVLQAIGV